MLQLSQHIYGHKNMAKVYCMFIWVDEYINNKYITSTLETLLRHSEQVLVNQQIKLKLETGNAEIELQGIKHFIIIPLQRKGCKCGSAKGDQYSSRVFRTCTKLINRIHPLRTMNVRKCIQFWLSPKGYGWFQSTKGSKSIPITLTTLIRN